MLYIKRETEDLNFKRKQMEEDPGYLSFFMNEEKIKQNTNAYVSSSSSYKKFFGEMHSSSEDFQKKTLNLVRAALKLKLIKENESGYTIICKDYYYALLCVGLTRTLFEHRKLQKKVLNFGMEHAKEIKKLYQKDPIIREFAVALADHSFSNVILYCILYVTVRFSFHKEFFLDIVKELFPAEYHICKEELGEDYRINNKVWLELAMIVHDDSSYTFNFIIDYMITELGCEECPLLFLISMLNDMIALYEEMELKAGSIPDTLKSVEKKAIDKAMDKIAISNQLINENLGNEIGFYRLFFSKPEKDTLISTAYLVNDKIYKESFQNDFLWNLYISSAINYLECRLGRDMDLFFEGYFQPAFLKGKEKPSVKKDLAVEDTAAYRKLLEEKRKLEEKNEVLRSQLEKAQQEVVHLQASMERQEESYKEKLKEMQLITEMQEEVAEIAEESIEVSKEEAIQYLSQFRCLFVGGHDHWIRQMQEIFPKWTFFTKCTESLQQTQNIDGIFFLTRHMSHTLFSKYVKFNKSKTIPQYMISQTNIEKVILLLYKCMKKQEAKK